MPFIHKTVKISQDWQSCHNMSDMIQKFRCDRTTGRCAQLCNPKNVDERFMRGWEESIYLTAGHTWRGAVPFIMFINVNVDSFINIQMMLTRKGCLMWRLKKKTNWAEWCLVRMKVNLHLSSRNDSITLSRGRWVIWQWLYSEHKMLKTTSAVIYEGNDFML